MGNAAFNIHDVWAIIEAANDQLSIYAGGAFYTQEVFPECTISLESPEDWLAWIIRDANFYERLAREREEELGFLWEEAMLLRRFEQGLTGMGVQPSQIKWPSEHGAYFYLMVDARTRAWKRRKRARGWLGELQQSVFLWIQKILAISTPRCE